MDSREVDYAAGVVLRSFCGRFDILFPHCESLRPMIVQQPLYRPNRDPVVQTLFITMFL